MATFLTSPEASQLLAGKNLCSRCVELDRLGEVERGPISRNALVVGPDDVIHAGDAIGGWTICGRDANRWRWIVPAAPGIFKLELEP